MKFILSIVCAVFTISLVYAHPNHLSFEQVRHTTKQVEAVQSNSVQSNNYRQEANHHSDVPLCNEQHQKVPCKKK